MGETAGERGGRGHQRQDAQPDDHADERGHQRDSGGDDAAEPDEQHDHRDGETDRLARQVLGLGPGELAQRPAVLDIDPGGAQRFHRRVDLVEVAVAQRGRVHVEPHGDVPGTTVLGQRRRRRRGRRRQRVLGGQHVRQLLQAAHHLVDLAPVVGQGLGRIVQDHLGTGAARGRIVRLQQLGPGVRLGAGQIEVVRVRPPERALESVQPAEGDQPGDDHHDEVAGAPFAQPEQPPPCGFAGAAYVLLLGGAMRSPGGRDGPFSRGAPRPPCPTAPRSRVQFENVEGAAGAGAATRAAGAARSAAQPVRTAGTRRPVGAAR